MSHPLRRFVYPIVISMPTPRYEIAIFSVDRRRACADLLCDEEFIYATGLGVHEIDDDLTAAQQILSS